MGESGSSWTEFEKSLPTGGLFCCLPDLSVATETDRYLQTLVRRWSQDTVGDRVDRKVLSASIGSTTVIISLLLLGLLSFQEPRVVGG